MSDMKADDVRTRLAQAEMINHLAFLQ